MCGSVLVGSIDERAISPCSPPSSSLACPASNWLAVALTDHNAARPDAPICGCGPVPEFALLVSSVYGELGAPITAVDRSATKSPAAGRQPDAAPGTHLLAGCTGASAAVQSS